MAAIWIRAVLYMFVIGGGWLVIFPAGLLLIERGSPYPVWNSQTIVAGGMLFAIGLVLALWAGYCLIQFGRGTPLPMDPTCRLVTCGPYRHVRNPQAIAMVLMVSGEILVVRSAFLWLLLPATLAYLELLVGPWEEWQLTRDFGASYITYATRVRKWVPRWNSSVNND